MATPAHATRMACSDQTKNTDGSGEPDGSESSLKNGTTFEDSEDSGGSGNMVVKNRGSGQQHGGSRETASIEQQFQDGGGGCAAPQPNSRPGSGMSVDGSYNVGVDRSRMNSDFQSFNQSNTRDPNPMVNDDFRTAGPDGYNHGCELGYPRGGYVSGDMGNSSASTGDISSNSQPNKMYPQYNQSQMRPGYAQSPRNMMGPQQRSPGPNMGRYPTGASSQQQQRFLLGPSIAQQTGPTPTLNQLLQAPNSLQRYHNSYDYGSNQGLHKNMGNPQYPGLNSSWGGMRASGYQQPQQMGSSMYRNQAWHHTFESWLKNSSKLETKNKKFIVVGGPNMGGDPSMKRPYSGGPTGGQISSPSPGPSPQGSQPQQYQPPPQQPQQQGGGPMSDASMKRPPYGGPSPASTGSSSNQLSSSSSSSPSAGAAASQGNQQQQQQQQSQQYAPQPYHQYGQQQSQGPTPTGVRQPPVSQNYPQQGVQQYPTNVQQQASPSQGPAAAAAIYEQHQRQQQPMPQYGGAQPHMQQPQQPPHAPPQHHQQQLPPMPQQQMPPASSSASSSSQMPPVQQQPAPQTQQQTPQHPQQPSQPHQTQQQQQHVQQQPPPHLQQQQQQQPSQELNSNGSSGCNSTGAVPPPGGAPGDDVSGAGDPSPTGGGSGSTTPGLRTPTTPPHPVVSPHRPVPSPSGPPTVGSPSMSSSLGQQQNIPMPPRPSSSSQAESSGQSPLSQPPPVAGGQAGYSQQMAPPSMYGNKMHQGIMSGGGSPVGPYSHQSPGHYAQGGYHRPPNSMNVQGYGGAQSQVSYPGQMSGPAYPPQSPMPSHRMSSHAAAGPTNYSSPSPGVGYPNAQYGSSGPPPASSGYGMSNMMPPPNQYPKANAMPPPTGGAQAAAQAAVMAAAASSGTIRQSPMYLRQHLQQKMYPGGYGGSSMSPVPPGAPGSSVPPMGSDSSPMPPPSSTPSSQPAVMGQTSPMPPQVSTPGGPNCDSNSVQSSMALAGFTQTSAPSLGPPPSATTQSISSPVPSAVTVSSPSIMGSDMMQSQQQGRGPMGIPQGPPPPPIIDEGSQASNASASSSLPEERVETPKPNSKPTMSHPPTPNALSSPGAASMSSFHDEFESVSSPSWPRTPASPVINNQTYDHHPIKRPDGMLKLYDMSDEPDRRMFLDKLIMYNEERGTPISQCPTISKQPLDLYRLYMACKERGGFAEVMKAKLWKDIAGLIGIGASSSAAYTLRKQYIKHLLPFECKYDRGGIDPGPLINSFESNSRKKNAVKNAMMNQEGYHQGGPMMDGYSSPYPGAYPPSSGPHPGMMQNADYPGHHPPYSDSMHPGGPMVNHSGSEGAVDPFSDEMGGSQYPQRHTSGDGYGYSQPSSNSGIPPYSGNQSSMAPPPSGQYGPYGSAPVSQPEPYSDQYPNSMGPPSSESSYGNRAMVADPYVPPGGYPPNRTVGPSNPPTYPPYQGPCDQERYDQPTAQGTMMRPQSAAGIGASPQDPSGYPPQHRYPSPSMPARENMPAQQMGSYQGRPPMPQSQYQGPNSQPSNQSSYPQSQQDSYRSASDYPPQMSRLQSTLIQRLQPKNQSYPSNQQGMYGQSMAPPNKVAPQSSIPGNMYQRDMYSMGPKRHGDYSKPPHGPPAQDQYHMGSYPQQSQGPYDRSQYPYRPTHGVPSPSGPQSGWSRDSRPYGSGPNQYQVGHREGWDVSRHGDGTSPGSGGWPRYSGPQQDPYSQHMGPGGMGPKMSLNRGYMSPNKMPPHPGVGPPSQYGPSSSRKEIIFPPDSVEAVTPVMSKRRRLLAKDLTPIDPWRIMMALKSGLLCESTWALDALSILICDDSTVLYFGLSHMPGLLEVLMDHYRCCLNLIFDLLGDLEVGFIAGESIYGKKTVEKTDQKWYELDRDISTPEETGDHSKNVLNGDSTPVLKSTNYTQRTRCRKYVRCQEEQALFLFDPDKRWDVYEGFISGSSHWQHGGGESTSYIQTHFENEDRNVRFVRIMEDVEKQSSEKVEDRLLNIDDNEISEKHASAEDVLVCKKECGSDTEEDEGLSCGAPSPRNEATKEAKNHEESEDKAEGEESSKCSDTREDSDDIKEDCVKSGNCSPAESKSDDQPESKEDDQQQQPIEEAEVFPKVRPSPCNRKRKSIEEMEDESYNRDEPSLCTTTDAQDSLIRRCICISTLLRNLSFVPGNDTEMSKHPGFLMVMGRLLLLNHVHSPRKPPQRHYDREEDSESTSVADSCSSLNCDQEWWWDMLHLLRENTLVTLANIAGQLDLAPFPEEISFPLLDGLMHWVTCPSSYAQDPLPTQPSQSVLSPQRLSLEALCKLSVLESNVDLMMATPPWQRIDRFFSLLAKWLSRNEDQVLREFSVVLLSNLSQADSSMARAIALQGTCIPLLITFVEQAEQSALQVANSQGINALRENPELMGTTLDMVRRAAGTLRCLSRVPTNRTLFLQHQQRLLALVMSQILDQGVASIIADVLYECSQDIVDEALCSTAASGEKSSLPPSSPSVATSS